MSIKHETTEGMTAAEIEARHCLGMCQDWAWHPAYEGEDHAGLRDFLTRCGEGLRWQMDEIERLRAALEKARRLAGEWDEYHPAYIAGIKAERARAKVAREDAEKQERVRQFMQREAGYHVD